MTKKNKGAKLTRTASKSTSAPRRRLKAGKNVLGGRVIWVDRKTDSAQEMASEENEE